MQGVKEGMSPTRDNTRLDFKGRRKKKARQQRGKKSKIKGANRNSFTSPTKNKIPMDHSLGTKRGSNNTKGRRKEKRGSLTHQSGRGV